MERAESTSTLAVVALTGSTGNFGSYLLDLLLGSPGVKKVYCLNRSRDARARQLKQNENRGLPTDFGKAEFIQADVGAQNWGLDHDAKKFFGEVDVVIHNAWPVDFNRSFASFSSHIDGVRQLIEFSRRRQLQNATKLLADSPDASSNESLDESLRSGTTTLRNDPIKIFFISSIGTVSNWGSYAPTSRESVPEDELTDWKLARTGYGQSKLLAERLLAYAAQNMGVPVIIGRVGQLAGPVLKGTKGAWPAQEWFPSLIKSSKTLKVVPADLGPLNNIDFVPVDLAAQITLELIGLGGTTFAARASKKRKGAEFFHIVNPVLVPWAEIFPAVLANLPEDVKKVSIVEWVDILKASAGEEGTAEAFQSVDAGDNPALKLFDSFDYMQDRAIRFPGARAAVLDTKRTARKSPTLAALHAVNREWMELWMKQWHF